MSENYHGVSVRSETTMTDDLKAPERIWAWEQTERGLPSGAGNWITHQTSGRVEYVPADRIATLEAALADMTQQRDAAMAGAVLTNDGVQAQLAEGIGAILRKFCDSDHASRARHHLHEMPKRDWDTLITMLADAVVSIPANSIAALSRIEAQAEARGMRKAAGHLRDQGYGKAVREVLALADATEAAAKGGV